MSAFNEHFYLYMYPDVLEVVNSRHLYSTGFEHYQRYGANEGRWGSDTLECNEVSYLAANPDVATAVRAGVFTSGYQHYTSVGRAEGRLSSPYGYFYFYYYRVENTDLQNTKFEPGYVDTSVTVSLARQFLTAGVFEGRSPSAIVFNEFGYLAKNPDVAAAIISGALPSAKAHYDAWGKAEGRDASGRAFDEADYLQRYPDVVQAIQRGQFASGEAHFGVFGKEEGRAANFIGRSIDASAATAGIRLVGAAGNDTLTGGSGNDTLMGLDGNNLLSGNAGDDDIVAMTGNNTISGGSGNDTITIVNGSNIIDGGTGNDYIAGGVGDNVVVGGDGNDTIFGNSGGNTLAGGDGADKFVYGFDAIFTFYSGDYKYAARNGVQDVIIDFQVGRNKIDVSQILKDNSWYSRDGTHVTISKFIFGRTDYDMSVTYDEVGGIPEAIISFKYGTFLYESLSNPHMSPNRSEIVLPGILTLAASDFIF